MYLVIQSRPHSKVMPSMEKKKKERAIPANAIMQYVVDNRCKFVTEKTNRISAILIFDIILFHKNEEMVEGTLLII